MQLLNNEHNLTLVTDTTDIKQFDYLIIGKSFAGLYVNAGFNGDNWAKPLHSHIINANVMLSQLDHDTLETVFLTAIDHNTADTYSDILPLGIHGNYVDNHASTDPLINNIHEVLPHAFHTDKESYEQPVNNLDMLVNSAKFDHYLSYLSELGIDDVKAYNGFGYGNFQQVTKEMGLYNRVHRDKPKYILLSRGALSHVDIIERLAETRKRILDDDIQAFIN